MAGYKHLEIVQDFDKYVRDKKVSSKFYYRYFLTRLLRMFQYKNLPDTIPHEILDRYLFTNGIACITEVEGELYCFYGNLGGEQDVYYRPTEFIVANPHIKKNGETFSANIKVFPQQGGLGQPIASSGIDGVLIRNDSDWVGLHPLIARYSYLMAENILTLRTADVMLRIIALITAKTDAERTSALEYLKSLDNGVMGIIGESSFNEGINLQSPPSNNGSYLTQFIEYQQYLKGSFFNEVGLSANYNMKREAIGKGESTLDEDALLPLCDNMLKTRQEDIAKVNALYGTNIEVSFSSAWLENRIEALSSLKSLSSPTSSFSSFGFGNGLGQPTDMPSEEGESTDESTDKSTLQSVGEEAAGPGAEPLAEQVTGNETGTAAEPETGSYSLINDLSVDEELTEIINDLVNQEPSKPLTMEDMEDDEEGDEEDESSEDNGHSSDN